MPGTVWQSCICDCNCTAPRTDDRPTGAGAGAERKALKELACAAAVFYFSDVYDYLTVQKLQTCTGKFGSAAKFGWGSAMQTMLISKLLHAGAPCACADFYEKSKQVTGSRQNEVVNINRHMA